MALKAKVFFALWGKNEANTFLRPKKLDAKLNIIAHLVDTVQVLNLNLTKI